MFYWILKKKRSVTVTVNNFKTVFLRNVVYDFNLKTFYANFVANSIWMKD